MTKKHWDAILQWRITRMWRQMGWGRGSWWGRWRSVRVTAASLSARDSPIPHSTKPVPCSWTKPHLSLLLVLATISTTTLALLVSIMEFQTCMCSAQISSMCYTQIALCLVHFTWFLAHLSLKVQVSFSDQNLSVVGCRCRKLFTFSSSSPEPPGQFQLNLVQSILAWMRFKIVQIKGPILFHGEIITK